MGHIQKRGGGRWRARYRDPHGKERSRTFDTQRDAKAWLTTMESDVVRGDWVSPEAASFEEWASRWLGTLGDRKPETRRVYESTLRLHAMAHLGEIPVDRIDRLTVREWITAFADAGLSTETIGRALGVAPRSSAPRSMAVACDMTPRLG